MLINDNVSKVTNWFFQMDSTKLICMQKCVLWLFNKMIKVLNNTIYTF